MVLFWQILMAYHLSFFEDFPQKQTLSILIIIIAQVAEI